MMERRLRKCLHEGVFFAVVNSRTRLILVRTEVREQLRRVGVKSDT